jgi:exonuclease SbcC
MFKRLSLHNFRSHKNTILEFVQGINVSVGDSRSGKTNLMRAVKWLSENRPAGDRVRSVFAGKDAVTEVVLELDDGTNVSIQRVKGKVSYRVGAETFNAVGTNVPDLVSSALNLNEINMQTQLEQHFLITSSAGEVARAMNRIVRIEDVDGWTSLLSSRILEGNKKIRESQEDLAVIEDKLRRYERLNAYEISIIEVERLSTAFVSVSAQVLGLTDFLQQLKRAEERVADLSDWLMVESDVSDVEKSVQIQMVLDAEDIIIRQFLSIYDIMEEEEKFLAFMAPIDKALQDLQNRCEALDVVVDGVNKLILSITAYDEASIKIGFENKLKEYISFLQKLGVCPFCGAPLNNAKAVDHIMKEMGVV